MSQLNRIESHLKKGKTLTSLQALQKFGCLRLAARIYDLRLKGLRIEETKIKVAPSKHVARYRMVK